MIKRGLFRFLSCILFVWTYFFSSISVIHKFYMVFSFVSYALLTGFILYEIIITLRRKYTSPSLIFVEETIIILLSALILYRKPSIDIKNILVLNSSGKNTSVYYFINNSIEANNKTQEYDSLFRISEYKDNIIYYTDKSQPALKPVYAYLDKAKHDNLKLFGDIPTGKLKVKFDYDEAIFKKRNTKFQDYAGLYSHKDESVYIYINDCYIQALSHDLESVYLRQVLFHEYTHHVFYKFIDYNQIPEKKVPVWFMEGVCEYIGHEGYCGQAPENMTSFSELNTQEQWTNYCNKGYNVYEQSHFAIRQLIITNGKNVIKDILLKVKYKDFNTAFNEATGISLENYEKALINDFKNGWSKFHDMVPIYKSVF